MSLAWLGFCVNTTILNQPLTDAVFHRSWMNSTGVAHSLHPAVMDCCAPLIADHHLTWEVGAPMEDTISIMQLIWGYLPGIRTSASSILTLAGPCRC